MRPTARWNPEKEEIEYLTGGAAEPAPAYTPGQDDVKGRWFTIQVPWSMVEPAEAAGVNLASTIKAGAIRAVKEATKVARGDTPIDRSGNSPQAANARFQLGLEMQARRKEIKVPRRTVWFRVCQWLDSQEIPRYRGWGESQIQSWELGTAAPRMIEPIIAAYEVEGEVADRWARLWAQAKRGVDAVPEPALLPPLEDIEADIAEQERELERQIAEAAGT